MEKGYIYLGRAVGTGDVHLISIVQWHRDYRNRWVWVEDGQEVYTVRFGYNALSDVVMCQVLRFSSSYRALK